ncbi:hypothetical protein GE21DRAFT_1105849 [Neurospora crassa]|nr:hypothetical protein GE21DRAFT_1105849 [Neurospora crassa]
MLPRYCRLPAKRTAQRTQGGSLLPGSLGVRCLLCFVYLGFRLNLKKRGLHYLVVAHDRPRINLRQNGDSREAAAGGTVGKDSRFTVDGPLYAKEKPKHRRLALQRCPLGNLVHSQLLVIQQPLDSKSKEGHRGLCGMARVITPRWGPPPRSNLLPCCGEARDFEPPFGEKPSPTILSLEPSCCGGYGPSETDDIGNGENGIVK